MRINPALLRLRHAHKQDSSVKVPEHTIHLQIRGLSERLSFEDGTEVILGRTDLAASPMQRLDLSPYGAHDRGVSREHALLRYSEHILTITDLNSANGTTLNLNKLQPNQPHALNNGDEFMLGSLSIVVHFEPEVELKMPAAAPRFDETLPMSQTMAFDVAHKAGAVAIVGSAPVSREMKNAELK
jgi:FHA domain